MNGPLILAVPVAAAAGAITFASPCCLPLIPGYLSYVAGMSGAGAERPGAGAPRPAAEEGEEPSQWGGDGRFLYVSRRGILPRRVYRLDLATGRKEFWREFSPSDPAGLDGITGLRMTPDGKAYVYGYLRLLSVLYIVEGLK